MMTKDQSVCQLQHRKEETKLILMFNIKGWLLTVGLKGCAVNLKPLLMEQHRHNRKIAFGNMRAKTIDQ